MKTFILRDKLVLERCISYLQNIFQPGHPIAVIISPADRKRTLEQNDKLHKMLRVLQDEGWIKGQQAHLGEALRRGRVAGGEVLALQADQVPGQAP